MALIPNRFGKNDRGRIFSIRRPLRGFPPSGLAPVEKADRMLRLSSKENSRPLAVNRLPNARNIGKKAVDKTGRLCYLLRKDTRREAKGSM